MLTVDAIVYYDLLKTASDLLGDLWKSPQREQHPILPLHTPGGIEYLRLSGVQRVTTVNFVHRRWRLVDC